MIATFSTINKIKPFNEQANKDDISRYIREQEQFEIKRLLGERLFVDLNSKKTESIYVSLIEPKTYIYQNYTYEHQGLLSVIAYLVHAIYVMESGFKDTYKGFVSKNNNDSRDISKGDKANLSTRYKELAFSYYNEIEEYICRFSTDYPLWGKDTTKRRTRLSRIKKVNYEKVNYDITRNADSCRG